MAVYCVTVMMSVPVTAAVVVMLSLCLMVLEQAVHLTHQMVVQKAHRWAVLHWSVSLSSTYLWIDAATVIENALSIVVPMLWL